MSWKDLSKKVQKHFKEKEDQNIGYVRKAWKTWKSNLIKILKIEEPPTFEVTFELVALDLLECQKLLESKGIDLQAYLKQSIKEKKDLGDKIL